MLRWRGVCLHGVAEGGVADNVVPMFDWDLAGDNGRGAPVAIIKDLQQVAPFGLIENRDARYRPFSARWSSHVSTVG
jgi:hypothetical protein